MKLENIALDRTALDLDPTRHRLRNLIEQWREEARRLDALGARYYEGQGSRHPEEWIVATRLRKDADQLEAVLRSQ